jgi:hypothetical protein
MLTNSLRRATSRLLKNRPVTLLLATDWDS